MSRARRKSAPPSTPEEIALRAAQRRSIERDAARQPVNWGLNEEALDLPANAAVERGRVRRGREMGAIAMRVIDAFDALNLGGFAKRLLDDLSIAARVNPNDTLRTEVASGDASSDGVTGAMIEAGRRLAAVEARCGASSWRLLLALAVPPATRGESVAWREIVRRVTGEGDPHAQGARVRAACENLQAAYELADGDLAQGVASRRVAREVARRREDGGAVKGRVYGR